MADISVTSGYDGLNLPYSPEAEQSVLGAVLLLSLIHISEPTRPY